MKKKNYLLAALVATAVTGTYGAINTTKCDKDLSSLELANIEALSVTESVTTWSCIGANDKPCGIKCGICGTEINSTGTLIGSHSCRLQ